VSSENLFISLRSSPACTKGRKSSAAHQGTVQHSRHRSSSPRIAPVHMRCIRKRQKPQAPIRNRQTRKVANAKVRNRQMIGIGLYRLGSVSVYELWRLRVFSLGCYGLALAALALVVLALMTATHSIFL